jgi:hypothetical protein
MVISFDADVGSDYRGGQMPRECMNVDTRHSKMNEHEFDWSLARSFLSLLPVIT